MMPYIKTLVLPDELNRQPVRFVWVHNIWNIVGVDLGRALGWLGRMSSTIRSNCKCAFTIELPVLGRTTTRQQLVIPLNNLEYLFSRIALSTSQIQARKNVEEFKNVLYRNILPQLHQAAMYQQDKQFRNNIKATEEEGEEKVRTISTNLEEKTQVLKPIEERIVFDMSFRMYGDIENPLFLAKDVAMWINYSTSSINKMLNRVDESEKTVRKISPSGSNYQTEAWFVTEDGLYEILMTSQKPAAKLWKKEVKKILKELRMKGHYIITRDNLAEVLLSPDTIIKLAQNLKAEQQKSKELQQKLDEVKNFIASL